MRFGGYMLKYSLYALEFFCLLIFCIGCRSLEQIIQLDTNLDYFENNITTVLFETEPGCSKTNFNFTDDYHKLNIPINNCFTAYNFDEYENTLKKYFEMEFFEEITEEYFIKNILIVIVLSANDGEYFNNGRFENGGNNKFIYKIELWDNGKPFLFRNKCSYIKVFILNVEK
jgi:hypothetical protein